MRRGRRLPRRPPPPAPRTPRSSPRRWADRMPRRRRRCGRWSRPGSRTGMRSDEPSGVPGPAQDGREGARAILPAARRRTRRRARRLPPLPHPGGAVRRPRAAARARDRAVRGAAGRRAGASPRGGDDGEPVRAGRPPPRPAGRLHAHVLRRHHVDGREAGGKRPARHGAARDRRAVRGADEGAAVLAQHADQAGRAAGPAGRVVTGPAVRLRENRAGAAGYAAVLSLVVLALTGAVGLALKQPWLFPSLGPTVMLFFESPEQPSSRPQNALVGHGVGLVAGAACFYALGLNGQPSVPVGGITLPYLVAGALSVAITTLVLTLLNLPHPPAGATTLIVSLGILTQPPQLLAMAGAIILITLVGWGLNALLIRRRR